MTKKRTGQAIVTAGTREPQRVLGLRVTSMRRYVFFVTLDAILVSLSLLVTAFLRGDGDIGAREAAVFPFFGATVVAATLTGLALLRTYRVAWSYFGLRDVGRIAVAVAGATGLSWILIGVLSLWGPQFTSSRDVAILQAPVTFCALSAFRVSKRAWLVFSRESQVSGSRTLLVGGGETGAQVLRSIQETSAAYEVLGFIDEDPLAQGTTIYGVRVLGVVAEMSRLLRELAIETVIITLASPTNPLVQSVVRLSREAGVDQVRIVPSVVELVDGRATIASTREVSLEDLLGRGVVHINHEEVRGLVNGWAVFVTGAAGTIGAELSRQIARLGPSRLVVLDVDESRLHDLELELRALTPELDVRPALVDVRDSAALDDLMMRERPRIVFHAAAYKHVPMMERWPLAALDVNVVGTANVLRSAEASGVERFVLISTDKAVEPSSIMGASKRLAEMVVLSRESQSAEREGNDARGSLMIRSAVRFGNVIGSRGSVIPTFEQQLLRGGPITVTHPEITRFFMMTSEAVSLILQAAALGKGNEVFVLDMGTPVRIMDVAREFVILHGLKPDVDVPIVISGLRPGEKLHETLSYPGERLEPTGHPRILRTQTRQHRDVEALVGYARELVLAHDGERAQALFHKMFPSLEAFAADPGAARPSCSIEQRAHASES